MNEAECCIKQFESAPVEQESAVKTSPFTLKKLGGFVFHLSRFLYALQTACVG